MRGPLARVGVEYLQKFILLVVVGINLSENVWKVVSDGSPADAGATGDAGDIWSGRLRVEDLQ